MPPVVTGSVVAVIGLNLASIRSRTWRRPNSTPGCRRSPSSRRPGRGVHARHDARLLILVGLIVASVIYAVLTNGLGWASRSIFAASPTPPGSARRIRRAGVRRQAMLLIAPVAIILVAENLGHLKAVGAMTGRDMDPYIGRAFLGDGVATMVSGSVGGTGVTTYAENIGVMAATASIRRRCSCRRPVADRARLLAQVRRADPDHPAAGDGRRVDRGVRPDRHRRRADLGRQQGQLSRLAEHAGGRHHPGAGLPAISP
jgi:hypothetical protein